MSFVTTQPEALTAAASKLQILGSSMAAQNAAAAVSTTGVAPAAADEVSALQATQFSAYGAVYQQVSAQASAIHQMLVNTLGTSAGTYGETEAANQSATGSTSLSGLAAASAAPTAADPPSLSSILNLLSGDSLVSTTAGSTLGTPLDWGQNFGAAASDFISLGQGQSPPPSASSATIFSVTDDAGAGLPAVPAAAVAPAALANSGGAPVSPGVSGAPPVGELSVPPSWAADGVPTVNSTPAALAGAGWTSAAPQTAAPTAMPAGVPAVASAGPGSLRYGAPRYGVKPNVMPKPAVV